MREERLEEENEIETVEEKLTLKSLKKELDIFKEEVFKRLPFNPLPPVHGFATTSNPSDVAIPNKPAKEKITFNFHDRFTEPRIFSEQINGEDWHDLANEFHHNNQSQIKKREDL